MDEAKRMPPVLREVFLLTHVRELPMAEVAEELGISVAATKSRLLRARSILRDRLNRWHSRNQVKGGDTIQVSQFNHMQGA